MNKNKPIWIPTKERIKNANISKLQAQIEQAEQVNFTNYSTFHQWSIQNLSLFWKHVIDFCGVNFTTQPESIYEPATNEEKDIRSGTWCKGSKLNFAQNLLRHCSDEEFANKEALVEIAESGRRRTMSYQQLALAVEKVALSLKQCGVIPGDRVAAVLPNGIDTIIAMLGATSIGAIWSSCSADFGPDGIKDRFTQVEPKVLFCCDGYTYKGKVQDTLSTISELLPDLPSVEHLVVIPYLETDKLPKATIPVHKYQEWMNSEATGSIPFEQLPFDHPIFILFSSGTTGVPKCIAHGAGGILLEHMKEWIIHTDLKAEDRFFYHTTCGWMMWNMLVSGLASGCSLILYDGQPFFPTPNRFFDLIDKEKITIFGTSAPYITAVANEKLSPIKTNSLKSLKTICSTGAPLTPELFDYTYTQIKQDLNLASITGGTDICGLFASGNPVLPVYRGELQCRCLGKDVQIFDDNGNSITEQLGELVCCSPFPSMPVMFWNDADGSKYNAAYFEKYPNIWHHGDFACITQNDGMILTGRSDAVLNPGGVRIGTAEIYRQVEPLEEIADSVAVGLPDGEDVKVVLFIVLNTGYQLDEILTAKIRSTIREGASPRHVPKEIHTVPAIPITMSGKKVELAIKKALTGQSITNRHALKNPEALDYFGTLKI